MKRKITILAAAFALLAFLALPMGMRGQTRTEESLVALTFPDDNSSNNGLTSNQYTSTWIAEIDDYSWSISNFNNNNWNNWTYIKCGRKNNTSVASITNSDAYSEAITKVELTITNITSNNVNFIKLYTSSDNSTWIEAGTFEKSTGTKTVALNTPTANLYYKIEFDCASGSSNGLVTVSKVEYYYNAGGSLPVVTPSITPEGGPFYESREVSISCATEGATIHYTTNGSDPTSSSPTYTVPFTINATTTVKAIGVKDGMDDSSIASAVFTKVTPMSVADAIAAIETGPTPIVDQCVTGIVCTASSNIYSGKLSYWISDDGTTTNRLEAYNGLGLDGANFESVDDVQVGDVVVIYGNLTKYNSTYEFAAGNYLLSLVRPAVTVEAPTFSPAGGTYNEIQYVTISCATPDVDIFYTMDGTEPTDESTPYSGAITVSETTTIKAIAYDGDTPSLVASATYTINLPYSGPAYARVDNVSYLTDGVKVIFAARYDNDATHYYAMSNTASGKPTGVQFASTTSGNFEVLPANILNSESSYCWTVGVTSNGYTFTNATGQTIGYTSGTNFAIGGDNTEWTVENGTSGENAMVSSYTAFNIINSGVNARAFALNNSHNFGPYAISNNNNADYNFSIDIFVQGAEPVVTPSIVANDVEIAYDVTSGAIEYTINNPAGGVLTAATSAEWLTLGTVGETVPFTCNANTGASRTATVTLTYTYNRETVTKEVTVTQAGNPNATMTIAEVRAQGTGDVATIGTVTSFSVNNNNKTTAYIQDATAAIVVFGEFTVAVGDEIRVSGTLSTFNGLLEIGSNNNNPTVTVISSGNTINPTVMTIAEINASTNQGWYIRIENATVTAINNQNVTIAQNDATIVVRFASADDISFAVNDIISFNGNIGCYNSVQIAHPADVTVQQNTNPVINANNVTLAYNATSGEIPYTITNPVTGTTLNATTNADWISNINVGSESVTFTTTANEGDADRTATITLSYTGANNKEVTVTQEHFVIDYATLPFSFNGGVGDIANTAGLTHHGLGGDYGSEPKLKFDDEGDYLILHFDGVPGILSFDIKGNTGSGSWAGTFTLQTSEDGVTYTDMATYTDLTSTVQSEEFNNLGANVRYIKWIFTEKDNGNVGLGNIELQPYVAPQQYTLTVSSLSNVELFVFDASDESQAIIEGVGSAQVWNGTVIEISVSAMEGYVLESLMVDGVDVTSQINETGAYTFIMPTHDVTVTATAIEYVAGNYVRISDLNQLTDGCKVIIAARHNTTADSYYAMKNATSGKPEGTLFTSVTSGNDEAVASTITDDEDNYYWTVNVTENGYTFTNANGQMIGYTSGTNFATGGNNTEWTIELSTSESGLVPDYSGFVITNKNNTSRAFAFNGTVFGAYAKSNINGGYNFFLDFFVQTETSETVTQTIELAAGTNWVSFYVDTDLDALKAALETTGLFPITIKAKNDGQTTYNGTRWRGALNALDFAQMYKIEVPEDCEISLEGTPLDPAELSIIIKAGDNWIAFPFQQSMTVTELFTSFPIAGDVVRSKDDGQANYTNRWRGALNTLVSGQGYIYKSAATEERTFTFPTSTNKTVLKIVK